jgi:alkylation response protein AidB-like acyl-CoA dehydrogenase
VQYRIFTEEHEIFRKTVRDFVKNEIRPFVDEWEEKEQYPRAIFKRMGDLGFLGIRYPSIYGGSEADWLTTIVFIEELGRGGSLGFLMSTLVQTDMASPAINYLGSHEQKVRFLSPMIRGEKIGAIGVTEPNHGSDVASIETMAIKRGDVYIINGTKMFITNGTQADLITLAVRTGKKEEGYKGISLFVFETNSPGFSVGRKLKKLGNLASDTAELVFQDSPVPKENLLGEEGMGFYGIMKSFEGERLVGGFMAITGAQLALEEAIRYGKERIQFGRPIMGFQVIRHRIVDMLVEIEHARIYGYHVAKLMDDGVSCNREVSIFKLYSTEMAFRVANKALQIHGGYGYMKEYLVERLFRDIRLYTIGGGTSEIMKEIISKDIGLE